MPTSPRTVLIGFTFILLALCVPVVGKLIWDIPPEDMLRDTAAVLDGPAYAGVISTLGFLLWAAAAGICLFVSASQPNGRTYWLYAAAITLVLLTDDWLMLHENAPVYLGVSEYAVYGIYAIAMAYYVVHFRRILLRAEFLLLLAAFGGFGGSLVVDRLDGVLYFPGFYLAEDGLKMFGIMAWLLFHARLGYSFVTQRDRWVDFAGASSRQPRSERARRANDRDRRAPRPRMGGVQTE